MDIEISVTITAPDGTAHTDKIGAFSKGFDSAGDIGLSIEEGKVVLLGIQQKVVAAQCEAFCIKRARCTCCDRKLRGKGWRQIRYRTVFGDIAIESPRLYSCQCHNGSAKTFNKYQSLSVFAVELGAAGSRISASPPPIAWPIASPCAASWPGVCHG